jgi:hypothetical protein
MENNVVESENVKPFEITVEKVVESFKEKELTPLRGEFFQVYNGKTCACGLGAIAAKYFNSNTYELSKSLGEKFIQSFANGFDGINIDQAKRNMGLFNEDAYNLGIASWEAIKEKSPTNKSVELID